MQNEQIGPACIRRTFHRNSRGKYDPAFPVYQLALLIGGKYIGEYDQYKEYQSKKKTDLLQMNPFGKEKQDQASDKEDKANYTGLCP